jgi:hypothetical protein
MGFFNPATENVVSPLPHNFNDLASLKMAVHPCTAHGLSKLRFSPAC